MVKKNAGRNKQYSILKGDDLLDLKIVKNDIKKQEEIVKQVTENNNEDGDQIIDPLSILSDNRDEL